MRGDIQYRLFTFVRPMVDERPAIVLQEGYAHWQSTYAHVDNVAEAVAVACAHDDAAGATFNVSDAALSTLEIGALVAGELAWRGDFVLLPPEELPDRIRSKLRAATPRISANSPGLYSFGGFLPNPPNLITESRETDHRIQSI